RFVCFVACSVYRSRTNRGLCRRDNGFVYICDNAFEPAQGSAAGGKTKGTEVSGDPLSRINDRRNVLRFATYSFKHTSDGSVSRKHLEHWNISVHGLPASV